MVSDIRSRPLLSRVRKRWNARKNKAINDNERISEYELNPENEFDPAAKHSDTSCVVNIRCESQRSVTPSELETPRAARRVSGSELFHWGKHDTSSQRSNSWKFDDSLSFRASHKETPVTLSKRPSFAESASGRALLKRDVRKTTNEHLRQLAADLNAVNKLALNKKGSCHVYLDKFLAKIQVPKQGESMEVSTVVHRFCVLTRDASDTDESSQESTSTQINVPPEFNKALPESMSLHMKRNQVVLSCSKQVASRYQDFARELNDFCAVAGRLKWDFKMMAKTEGAQ